MDFISGESYCIYLEKGKRGTSEKKLEAETEGSSVMTTLTAKNL